MRNILFICDGNTCKSPMAEYLLKNKSNFLSVKSAGLIPFFVGQEASHNVIKVLRSRKISINHRVKLVNQELVEWSELILTTNREEYQQVS